MRDDVGKGAVSVNKYEEAKNNEQKFGKSELELLNLIAEIIVEIIINEEEEKS